MQSMKKCNSMQNALYYSKTPYKYLFTLQEPLLGEFKVHQIRLQRSGIDLFIGISNCRFTIEGYDPPTLLLNSGKILRLISRSVIWFRRKHEIYFWKVVTFMMENKFQTIIFGFCYVKFYIYFAYIDVDFYLFGLWIPLDLCLTLALLLSVIIYYIILFPELFALKHLWNIFHVILVVVKNILLTKHVLSDFRWVSKVISQFFKI